MSKSEFSYYGDAELDRLSSAFIDRAAELGLDAIVMCATPPEALGSTAGQYTGNFTNPHHVLAMHSMPPFRRIACEGCNKIYTYCETLAEAFPPDSEEYRWWVLGIDDSVE